MVRDRKQKIARHQYACFINSLEGTRGREPENECKLKIMRSLMQIMQGPSAYCYAVDGKGHKTLHYEQN